MPIENCCWIDHEPDLTDDRSGTVAPAIGIPVITESINAKPSEMHQPSTARAERSRRTVRLPRTTAMTLLLAGRTICRADSAPSIKDAGPVDQWQGCHNFPS
jgi:hypothetical protein